MPKQLKLPSVDIMLVVVLVVVALLNLSVFRLKASGEQDKVRLDARVRTAEQNVATAEKAANLESLTRALEQARSALGGNPFPGDVKMRELIGEVEQSAQRSGVAILTWNHSYTTAVLKTRRYPAVTHSMNVQGTADSLTSFVQAVTRSPVRPLMKSMNISLVTAKEDLWRLGLELVAHYHE